MPQNHSPRKKQFLDESLKMIHEKGYKATTMRDLAERMGFEVSNIYNFIDSKEALLETYLFRLQRIFTPASITSWNPATPHRKAEGAGLAQYQPYLHQTVPGWASGK
jgi:AcrR family transcriptional regulator